MTLSSTGHCRSTAASRGWALWLGQRGVHRHPGVNRIVRLHIGPVTASQGQPHKQGGQSQGEQNPRHRQHPSRRGHPRPHLPQVEQTSPAVLDLGPPAGRCQQQTGQPPVKCVNAPQPADRRHRPDRPKPRWSAYPGPSSAAECPRAIPVRAGATSKNHRPGRQRPGPHCPAGGEQPLNALAPEHPPPAGRPPVHQQKQQKGQPQRLGRGHYLVLMGRLKNPPYPLGQDSRQSPFPTAPPAQRPPVPTAPFSQKNIRWTVLSSIPIS